MAKVVVSFALDDVRDHRIIRYLDGQQNRSAAIREALDAHLGGGLTHGDLLQAIKALERKIGKGAVVLDVDEVPEAVDEPPDIAAALDGLGL